MGTHTYIHVCTIMGTITELPRPYLFHTSPPKKTIHHIGYVAILNAYMQSPNAEQNARNCVFDEIGSKSLGIAFLMVLIRIRLLSIALKSIAGCPVCGQT